MTTLSGQATRSGALLSGITANQVGVSCSLDGMGGTQMVEIQKTGTGTCNVLIEGSYDNATWYQVGYYQVDATASLTRAVGNIAVGASNPTNHVYQLLDLYKYLRATTSSVAVGPVSVNVTTYCTGF